MPVLQYYVCDKYLLPAYRNHQSPLTDADEIGSDIRIMQWRIDPSLWVPCLVNCCIKRPKWEVPFFPYDFHLLRWIQTFLRSLFHISAELFPRIFNWNESHLVAQKVTVLSYEMPDSAAKRVLLICGVIYIHWPKV